MFGGIKRKAEGGERAIETSDRVNKRKQIVVIVLKEKNKAPSNKPSHTKYKTITNRVRRESQVSTCPSFRGVL